MMRRALFLLTESLESGDRVNSDPRLFPCDGQST